MSAAPGYTPAPNPAETPRAPPCAVMFASAGFQSWSFWFDHPKKEVTAMLADKRSGPSRIIAAKHMLTMPDPTNPWDSLTKKNFKYNVVTSEHEQITTYKDGSTQINAMTIHDFLNHELLDPIFTDPTCVSSVDYVLTKECMTPTTEAMAVYQSKLENFDPAKKPAKVIRARPGPKRPVPASAAEPATEAAKRQRTPNGGSTSHAAS